jgi:hypothetical protein
MAITERINISRETLKPTTESCGGFDAFFFSVAALEKIEFDDYWHIGDTWWDWWLPLAFMTAGIDVRIFPAPVLLHLNHPIAWDLNGWDANRLRVMKMLQSKASIGLPERILNGLLETPPDRRPELLSLSQLLFDWLRLRSSLWQPDDDPILGILNGIATPEPLPTQGRPRLLVRNLINMLHLRALLAKIGLLNQ